MAVGSEAENTRQPAFSGRVSGESPDRPLWLAVTRLREQSARPHLQPMVVVSAADVEQVLDALAEATKDHREEGGEA